MLWLLHSWGGSCPVFGGQQILMVWKLPFIVTVGQGWVVLSPCALGVVDKGPQGVGGDGVAKGQEEPDQMFSRLGFCCSTSSN